MTTTDIQDLMLYGERINIEYKEAAGDLPKSLWETNHWRKPTLLNRTELRQVDLTMPMISLLPESVLIDMKAHYGEEAYHDMTSEEQMILAYVWNGDSISNTELQQLLGLNSIEVGKILHQMVAKQLLNKENKNRWTTYTLFKESHADSTSEEKSEEKTDVTDNVTVNVTDNVTDVMFLKLTERQKKICILLAKDTSLPASAMSELLSVSLRTVKRDLATLQEKGILIREGKAKNGRWVIMIPKKETNE